MRVLGFMSAAEAINLVNGRTLRNRADHKALGQSSDSVGFCFAIAGDTGGDDSYALHGAAKLLSGITTMDVCLIGDLHKNKTEAWHLGYGKYATGNRKEFSTDSYSLADFSQWSLYAPHDRNPLIPLYSANWTEPVLINDSQKWGQK